MSGLVVGELYLHPVKSARAVRAMEADVGPTGLAHDREFMVVDPRGDFLTQREHPELARLGARIEDGVLVLEADDRRPVRVPVPPRGPQRTVSVWGDEVLADDCGAEAAGLLTNLLGRPARLVRTADGAVRAVDPAYAKEGDRVSFADGFPILVTTTASIEAVRERAVAGAVDARRFRPNIVVAGAGAFDEDGWSAIEIGAVRLELVKPCSRCAIVDVDPDAGARHGGVLAALASFRSEGNKVLFGQNALVRRTGRIRVGDPVTIEPASVADPAGAVRARRSR